MLETSFMQLTVAGFLCSKHRLEEHLHVHLSQQPSQMPARLAGESVACVKELESTSAIINELATEAEKLLRKW